jgi:hypothetical protein
MSDKYPHLFGKLITDVNKLPDGAAPFNDCIEAIEEAEKTEKRVGIANNNRKNRRGLISLMKGK